MEVTVFYLPMPQKYIIPKQKTPKSNHIHCFYEMSQIFLQIAR